MSSPVSGSELRDTALFRTLKKNQLETIASYARRVQYAPHAIILPAHTLPKNLIIIRSGSVARVLVLGTHTIPLEHMRTGQLWGHFILLQPHLTTLQMLQAGPEGAETIEIPAYQLVRLFEQDSSLGITMAHQLLKVLAKMKSEDDELLACIYSINHILQGSQQREEQYQRILETVAAAVGGSHGAIVLFDHTAKRSLFIADYPLSRLSGQAYSLLSDTILSTVYTTGTSCILDHATIERKHHTMPYIRPTMLITPLIADGNVIGALMITDALRKKSFTTRDSALASVIGTMIIPLLIQHASSEHHAHHSLMKRSYAGSRDPLEAH